MAAALLGVATLSVACLILGWTAWTLRTTAALGQQAAELALARQALEAESRARAEAGAIIDQAWQRVRSPAQGRRIDVQRRLLDLAGPRRFLTDRAEVEQLDRDARSLFAATLSVPDLAPGEAIEIPVEAHNGWPLAFRPDGGAVAIGAADRPIVWLRGQKPALSEALQGPERRSRVWYSPDGRFLTVAPSEGGLHVWAGDGARRLGTPVPEGEGAILAVGFDTAGTTLRAVLGDGRVRSWSVPSWQEGPAWSIPSAGAADWSAAQFSPDGATVAAGDRTGHVGLYAAGRQLGALSDSTDRLEVQALAWAPDGQSVAIAFKGGRIHLRRRDGAKVREFRQPFAVVAWLEFSPDGMWLSACGSESGISVWDVATGELLVLGSLCQTAAFSRDGTSVACGNALADGGGTGVRLYEVRRPQAVQVLRGHADEIARLAWSDDGRRLASLDTAWNVCVWDVPRGAAVDAFPAPVGSYFANNGAVALNPDGSRLAYASGGDRESHILIRDVAAHAKIGEWPLPGGYEFLAAVGDDQFRLVREEIQPGGDQVHSVVYELAVGRPPGRSRTLRTPGPEDQRRFLNAVLTPDGRHYCWIGPRRPPAARRVEVWDVAAGRLTWTHSVVNDPVHVYFAQTGRYVWMTTGTGHFRYELPVHAPPMRFGQAVSAASPDGRWFVLNEAGGRSHDLESTLARDSGDRGWIRFATFGQEEVGDPVFSTDSRRLAWGTRTGPIYVADLDALSREVDAFERQFRAAAQASAGSD
jgi:WD40 repeat protein